MRLPVLMFANHATVDGGLLHANGAGWETYSTAFPGNMRGYVAGIIELDPTEQGAVTTLGFELVDDHGQVLGSEGSMTMLSTTAKAPGASTMVPFAFPFACVVDEPKTIAAVVSLDGTELGRVVVPVIALAG